MRFRKVAIPITGVWLDPIKPRVDPPVTDDWDNVAAHFRHNRRRKIGCSDSELNKIILRSVTWTDEKMRNV